MFIVLDGLDGSGKSTIIRFWAECLEQEGKKIFHLKNYWSEKRAHPMPEDLRGCDVIVSAEPTTVWTGAAIREEMIKTGTRYSARAVAEAYALDRLVLYTRVLLPMRERGVLIIQDRGVSASLCYQSVQDNRLSMEEIAGIEGNAFALAHAPDHLVIADITADTAMARLRGRQDKQDQSIFEHRAFLEEARGCFLDQTYQAYFKNRGTSVHILSAETPIDIMKEQSLSLLKKLTAKTTYNS